MIYNPLLVGGALVVNTLVPAPADNPLACTTPSPTGWTLAIDAASGAATSNPFFLTNGNASTQTGLTVISGMQLNDTGTGTVVTLRPNGSQPGGSYFVSQTLNGQGSSQQINPGATAGGSRVTWIQIR